MSTARHHAEWLSLMEISGPFLSMPVLLQALPQGLDAHDPDHARELRAAYEEWADNQAGLRPEPAIHTAWIRYVLQTTLGFPDEVLAEGQAISQGLKASVPEHGVTLRPDLVVQSLGFAVQSSQLNTGSQTMNSELRTENSELKTENSEPAIPLPISNRTVLHLLNALQLLQVKVPGGGPAEARRLSFRALDIEQIGHVYESLLDHTAVRADEPVLGLAGTRDKEPEIPLPALEAFWLNPAQPEQGVKEKELLDFLQEQTGRSTSALKKALPPATPPPDLPRLAKLRAACGNNDALYARVLPWANLVRDDDFGQPVVIPAGSVYVTAGTERRATGTHYTPKALTEPIVQHTLEPLVYTGPAQGRPREQWQLRPAANLLNLKVCDMAMGSGAFLVQACRYLSERLVEAWAEAEKQVQARAAKRKGVKGEAVADAVHNSSLTIHNSPFVTPEGQPATGDPGEQIIPADPDERLLLARRLVADRCLYGVDKNPLAVEMAKLSLWLITLDKNRPFTFLDHALKCGDSLVGVNLAQLLHWNLEAAGAQPLYADTIRTDLNRMVSLRRQLAALPVNTITDQAHKAHLLAKAEAVAHNLKRGGDMLIGSYFNDLPAGEQQDLRDALLLAFNAGKDVPPDRAPARPTCRRACAPSTGRWNFQRCFWTKAAADLMRLWAIHCLLVDGVFVKLLGTVIASCFMKFTQGLAGMQTTAHFSFLEVITIYNREEHWG